MLFIAIFYFLYCFSSIFFASSKNSGKAGEAILGKSLIIISFLVVISLYQKVFFAFLYLSTDLQGVAV